MKALRATITSLFLCMAGAAFSQVTTSPAQPPAQPVPQQDPATPTPNVDKKADLNYPQSPNRPANIPSEDTLIKNQASSGAVIEDRMMPATDKKAERVMKRKNRKGTAEMDDSTSTQRNPQTKP